MHLNRSGVNLPCGSKFTATNLAPGLYQLQAWLMRKPLAQRAFSYREIAVETDDVEAVLQTVPPVLIRGKVRPNVALAIGLRPLRGLSFAEEPPIKVAEDGAFQSLLFPRLSVEVNVSGVAAPQYVQSILYNGARAPGGVFEPDPYALEHSLEVVVANDGATLHGQVAERGDPVAGARVAMVKWPQVLVDGFPVMVTATCDTAGRFSQAGLAPGAYRVFAYHEADAPKLDLPGVVSAQAGSATEVTLPGGGAGTVTLEPAAL
jgi:hypothetical protein